MDLSTLNTSKYGEAGAVMHVRGPDDELLWQDEDETVPVTITLMGSDSPTYRREYHRIVGAATSLKVKGNDLKVDTKKAEVARIEVMASCTIKWDGIQFGGPDDYACTRQNAIALYTELVWLREQVSAYMSERTNYLGG